METFMTANVKDFGAVGDNTADNSKAFNSAINSIAKSGGILYLPYDEGSYFLGTSIKIPEGIELRFAKGAKIKLGNMVSIEGNHTQIKAGRFQIFDTPNRGGLIGTWEVDKIYPEWWGAMADNSTINDEPVRKSIEFSKYNLNKCIEFGQGTYLFDGTYIVLDRTCSGIRITGQCQNTTLKLKDNASGGHMFVISNFRDNESPNTDIYDIRITKMKAVGNTTEATTSWFLQTWTKGGIAKIVGLILDELDLSNFKTSGLSLENCYDCKLTNIHSSYNGFHGLSIANGSYTLNNIWVHNNSDYGINFTGGEAYGRAVATNIISENNRAGMKTAGVWDLNLSNSQFNNNYNEAITKTAPGGRYNFSNIMTKNNGGPSLNLVEGDGTEKYNIVNWHSESDNKTMLSNNGSIYFSGSISEIHGTNITVLDSGNVGVNVSCKNTFLTNVTVKGNNNSYPFRVYKGGLIGIGLMVYNNNSMAIPYAMQINTAYNVFISHSKIGDDRETKQQTRGIVIAPESTGTVIVQATDFSDCNPGEGIKNNSISAGLIVENSLNSGVEKN